MGGRGSLILVRNKHDYDKKETTFLKNFKLNEKL